MGLKELTADKHTEAENTLFMKAIFAGTLDPAIYASFLYQKMIVYNTLEAQAFRLGLFLDNTDFLCHERIRMDYRKRIGSNKPKDMMNEVVGEYVDYININLGTPENKDRLIAHIYTWHLGDLYGGQAIKNLMPGPNSGLEFENPDVLKSEIRSLLKDEMADEANLAFDYAIKILKVYDRDLEQNS
jgi:heme oxygenase